MEEVATLLLRSGADINARTTVNLVGTSRQPIPTDHFPDPRIVSFWVAVRIQTRRTVQASRHSLCYHLMGEIGTSTHQERFDDGCTMGYRRGVSPKVQKIRR